MTLHRCRSCGAVSGTPRLELTSADRYRHYYDGPAPPPPTNRYNEWIAFAESQVGRGTLLEVGAGIGGFAAAAYGRGWIVHATEMSETAAKALRNAGVDAFIGEVADAGFPDGKFDFVAALEVIEHLDRPPAHLIEWARVLRPGGLLLVTTPNWGGISGRMLGTRWRVVAPEHLVYFTTASLNSTIAAAGFRDVRIRSRALDLFAWKRPERGSFRVAFDPARAAKARDRVNRNPVLRHAKETVHAVLGLIGLGDTLLAWARK
jgi:SAM-dependent methyltransferase